MKVTVLSLSALSSLMLVGCGGGSSTPATDSGSENTVLTGIFIDSPVEGAAYATATQSGMTNAAGEFSYLADELVTFSIGTTQLPAVTAAARVSPVDMAESSSNSAATTTNIARLLQSLDQDGNPDNGITISAVSAASSASINFDVATDVFENDQAVINLVANSGSVTTTLVSAEMANAHLDETLNGPTAVLPISGLWARGVEGSPGFDGYLDIDTTSLVQYNVGERDSNSVATCYIASLISITPLENNLYDVDGQEENVAFVRVGDILEVTTEGESTRAYPLVTDIQASTLPICSDSEQTGGAEFSLTDLVQGSPWYSIRVYSDRQECGVRYSFASDGSLTAGSISGTITGTYTLSDTGLIGLDTVQFGIETRQLNTLDENEWTSNSINNAGGEFLERSFASRDSALAFSSGLGTNCESVFPL